MTNFDFSIDDIGQKLQIQREKRKISQRQVAEAIGTSIHHLSAIERGLHKPSVDIFFGYCKVLNLTPDEILGISNIDDDIECIELIKIIRVLKKHQIKYLLVLARDLEKLNKLYDHPKSKP